MNKADAQKLIVMFEDQGHEATKIWLDNFVAEATAKEVLSGKLIDVALDTRSGGVSVKAKPVGEFFALHNEGEADYETKGVKALTHIPSGQSMLLRFRAPLREVLALSEKLTALDVDWSSEKLEGKDRGEALRIVQDFRAEHGC